MIMIVNYGLGNVRAIENIYRRLNISVSIVNNPEELASAEKIILPGVGSFDWAMSRLNKSGMEKCLNELVLQKKRPVLGICIGMQMMANSSEEGMLPGLGWLDGEIKCFDSTKLGNNIDLPHMGWNDVVPVKNNGLFKGIESPRFYFLHSYYFSTFKSNHILAETDYNGTFTSAINSENIFGTQFHPEKSHNWGIKLLKNFAEL